MRPALPVARSHAEPPLLRSRRALLLVLALGSVYVVSLLTRRLEPRTLGSQRDEPVTRRTVPKSVAVGQVPAALLVQVPARSILLDTELPHHDDGPLQPVPQKTFPPVRRTPPPFLPYSCEAPAALSSLEQLVAPTMLFAGTGQEVRRVLRRAARSSLYGQRRQQDGTTDARGHEEDELPFQILMLGGSVSNCRGVPMASCWHSHMMDWFRRNLPLEHDPRIAAGPSLRRIVKRAIKSLRRPTRKPGGSRLNVLTRLINGARSATGSRFYSYCMHEELATRHKNLETGSAPDLVILEFGVNDVFPLDASASADFERLVRQALSLPSRPAVVVLEAASLFLDATTGAANVEVLHLDVARRYDLPVISARSALFAPGAKREGLGAFFLEDQHHFNERGHEFMGRMLTRYLEEQMCIVQSDALVLAGERRGNEPRVEPADLGRRRDEESLPLPREDAWLSVAPPVCLQIGRSDFAGAPVENSGWTSFTYSRDKQYLIPDAPGAVISFAIEVGEEGRIVVDYLRSKFYNLGTVLVYLDDDPSMSVELGGNWNLGWSIGVPETVFTGVPRGLHTVSFRSMPASRPHLKQTSFRLMSLIAL